MACLYINRPARTNTNANGNVYYSNVHYIFSAVEHNQKLDLHILFLCVKAY